ncbi:protein trichome birefringence-like 33 isoform X2 [Brachypodium distachyon]|uniref:Uncharacterized protein n=1 Tax=Brachypodium distachyon TaxID=15368 RepID=A0A2K2DB34_BRADI|nr:protein trichome birefringence-like 33 isoform X2 [Brachypodium distachyon]PNT71482.1 hypothetical protein BRADI_2g28100v3 [Brachypodium distachyon]|eukprot:XP_014755026.2 protein trichome birefringence-like 33 isoform X2 [Brachypodium distachyon]
MHIKTYVGNQSILLLYSSVLESLFCCHQHHTLKLASKRRSKEETIISAGEMKAPLHPSSPASAAFLCKKARLSPLLLVSLLFMLLFSFLYGEELTALISQQARAWPRLNIHNDDSDHQPVAPPPPARHNDDSDHLRKKKWEGRLPFAVNDEDEDEECELFSGSWVWDEEAHPLYREEDCPYIQPQLACQAHGRPDKAYRSWRWQPHDCTLPVFNATLMLETLRDKRMMFVGDSLNRGQFTSMVCLLQSAIPSADAKSFEMSPDQQHTVFTARAYNATVEFYWAPFLLQSNADDAVVHRISDRTVRNGSIAHHGRHWKGAHVLVFNTYLWWCSGLRFRIINVGTGRSRRRRTRSRRCGYRRRRRTAWRSGTCCSGRGTTWTSTRQESSSPACRPPTARARTGAARQGATATTRRRWSRTRNTGARTVAVA